VPARGEIISNLANVNTAHPFSAPGRASIRDEGLSAGYLPVLDDPDHNIPAGAIAIHCFYIDFAC
jgi:hypothetical protein